MRKAIITILAVLIGVALIEAPAQAVTAARPVAIYHRDAVWSVESYPYVGTVNTNPYQHLTARWAPGRKNAPWIVLLHGGSWYDGDRASVESVGELFAAKGWQVFNVDYRLYGAAYTDQLADLMAAKTWIVQHATHFGIDPLRGAVFGFSAGGHLAAMLGLTGGFRAVVSVSGVLEPQRVDQDARGMRPETEPSTPGMERLAERERDMMGCAYTEDGSDCMTRWRAFMPQRQITSSAPPFLIYQGLADPVVPPPTANAFAYWLRKAGVEARVVLEPGLGHTLRLAMSGYTNWHGMLQFVADRSR